jgi:hypothetical protein
MNTSMNRRTFLYHFDCNSVRGGEWISSILRAAEANDRLLVA